MPERYHSKIESFLIHLVAVLFTFSTLSAAFLSYGVYQSNPNAALKVAPPVKAADFPTWTQNSWSGGPSNDVYTINWNTTGGWTKYSSQSGVTFGANGFTMDNGGYIISSVFNPSPKRVVLLLLLNFDDKNYTYPINTMYFRGASSPSEINTAPWIEPGGGVGGWCTVPLYPYVQYKIENNTGSPIPVPDATIFASLFFIGGQVKDAQTSNPIQGATVSYSGSSVTTNSQGGYQIVESNLIPSTAFNLTAAKSGYVSQTKSIDTTDACDDVKTLDFDLSTTSGSSPSPGPSGQTSSNQNTQTSSPSVSLSEFKTIDLPATFTAPGSTTTDLSKITDPTKVENFTIDIPGKNKIVFNEALDLSSEKTVATLKQLDNYVKISNSAAVELDTSVLSVLNKKATITMYNLEYLFSPEILVNGEKDTKGVVTDIQYDAKGGTLVFGVSHFTTFSAVPRLELMSPASRIVKETNAAISGRISDPKAVVTGELNGVKLAIVTPMKETGIFMFTKLKFKEGANKLIIRADSKLGKVLPLVTTITYFPANATTTETQGTTLNKGIIIIILSSLVLAILLGYLVYRERKRLAKILAKNNQQPPQIPT